MDIEPSTLIWIARIVFFIIATMIAFGAWRFMQRERWITVQTQPTYTPPQHIDVPEKKIILTVIAQPGRVFDNEQLFSVMEKLGFKYSSNKIFGYFLPHRPEEIAFRIVNIKRPHTFDRETTLARSTNGLMAVMELPVGDGDNQVAHFHLLLSVLDEVRTNLDATLCDIHRNPMKNKKLYAMQKDIETFEQSYLHQIQNDYRHNRQ